MASTPAAAPSMTRTRRSLPVPARDWWRSLPLAAQLLLTTLAVVAFWSFTWRQLVSLQDARRERATSSLTSARETALLIGALEASLAYSALAERGYRATRKREFIIAADSAATRARAIVARLRHTASSDPAFTALVMRTGELLTGAIDQHAAENAGTVPSPLWGGDVLDSARATGMTLASIVRARVALEEAALRQQARLDKQDALIVRVALFAMIVLVMLICVRKVTRDLGDVVCDARALAAGWHDTALRSRRGWTREVRELAAAFDTLAAASAEREHRLKSDIQQLKALEQLKSDFVSTVSHELRTPLTSMRGALGLVLAGAGGAIEPRVRELLQIALQNTERLIRLINDMLDIEKLEAGHPLTRVEPCDLGKLLRSTVASLKAYAIEADVTFQVDGVPSAVVAGDPDRLIQVFTNLISNAVKFSPHGAPVAIELATTGNCARVSVSDRGPGIPPEFEHRIFGKFQQASHIGTPGSTGLGLSIARAIVERHGGVLRFERRPEGGTTFVVELPYTPPLKDASTAAAGRNGANGHRLLLVDHDPAMLSVLDALCQPLGAVVGVRSADDAWTAVHRAVYDAVIIDPELPGADGLGLLRRVRALNGYEDAPMLIFSTREYAHAELDGAALSPSHAFVKSRDREQDLLLRLKAVLAVRRPKFG